MARSETPDARRRRVIYLERLKEEAELAAARLRAEKVVKEFELAQKRSIGTTLRHSLGDALRAKGYRA